MSSRISSEDWPLDDLGDCLQDEVPFRMTMDASINKDYAEFISSYIDCLDDVLRPINLKIHDNPELCYEETIAHETLVSFLESRTGWKVTPSAYGIATAFIAQQNGKKEGPIVSFNAEYDALPAIGHACGHNLIATASLSAALAVGAAIEKFDLPGRVVLFGTPAEEGGGGKIKLLDAGAYKDRRIDVSLMAHPGKVEYFGREAHAAASPWEGINALDAIITAYNSLSVLRQQTMPGDIIQGHITNGGLVPNIIYEYASGVFVVRANTKARLKSLKEKVDACFRAGAEATGAKLKMTFESSYDDHTPNHALARRYRHYFNALGGKISEPEIDFIHGKSSASTDQGNISHAYPSLHSGFQIESEFGPHNPGFTEVARTIDAYLRALKTGKALAATAVDVLMRPEYLKEIKDEFGKLDRE